MARIRIFLIASYRNPDDAAQTIRELRRTSLSDRQVGLLVRDDHEKSRFKSIKEFADDREEAMRILEKSYVTFAPSTRWPGQRNAIDTQPVI